MEELGLPIRIVAPPDAAEPAPLPDEAPASYAVRAAIAKAAALLLSRTGPESDGFSYCRPAGHPQHAQALPANAVLIAADTVVALNGRIFGKPQSPEEALDFLRQLAGKTHEVITGCALEGLGTYEHFACRTQVSMWNCPDALLTAYAHSGEPMDKAGAYAIQGKGAFLVDSIQGSWSNVVGLPLAEVIQGLLRMAAIVAVP